MNHRGYAQMELLLEHERGMINEHGRGLDWCSPCLPGRKTDKIQEEDGEIHKALALAMNCMNKNQSHGKHIQTLL